MSDMKAFEIHTYQSGKWKIDSVFDDRDLAMFEASRMDESGRYSGVRVIEEIFVEQTQQTRTRTIFRGSKVEANNAAELRKSKQARQQAQQNRAQRQKEEIVRRQHAHKRAIRKKSSPVRLFYISLFILALAGGMMYGLYHLQTGL
jgi:hypothetical protein